MFGTKSLILFLKTTDTGSVTQCIVHLIGTVLKKRKMTHQTILIEFKFFIEFL